MAVKMSGNDMKTIRGNDEAVEEAVRSFIFMRSDGSNQLDVIAAFDAWGIAGNRIEQALHRLVHIPAICRNTSKKSIQDYPTEVSAKEAARILGCSKDTVLKFKDAGLLEYRNLASPKSSRPLFRFRLESVVRLRTEYQADIPTPPIPKEPGRRRLRESQPNGYKHLRLN